jgi:hypothetical protein
METKHTSLPWVLIDDKRVATKKGDYASGIADVFGNGSLEEYNAVRKANATFIVRSCNAHDALVDALENLLNGIDTGAITSDHDEILSNAVQKARDAINKARRA